MFEFFLSLMDLVLNIITLGGWGRSQGEKSSGVYRVNRDDE
jgi:hypothetical protein